MNFLSGPRPFTNSIKASFWKFICKCAAHQNECVTLFAPFSSIFVAPVLWIHAIVSMCSPENRTNTMIEDSLWTHTHTHIRRIEMWNVCHPFDYFPWQMCGNHLQHFKEHINFWPEARHTPYSNDLLSSFFLIHEMEFLAISDWQK